MTIQLFHENNKVLYIIDYNIYIAMVESRNCKLCSVGSCPGISEMYYYIGAETFHIVMKNIKMESFYGYDSMPSFNSI